MFILMLVLGLLLIASGGTALFLGFDIVVTDRGLAMVLAGVTALSAGVITLGLAFLLKAARDIARSLAERANRPVPSARPARPVVPLAEEAEAVARAPAATPAVPVVAAAAAVAASAAAVLAQPRAADPDEPELPLPEPLAGKQPPTVAAFEEALQRALQDEAEERGPVDDQLAWPKDERPAEPLSQRGQQPVASPETAPEPLEDAAIFVDEPPPPVIDPPRLAWPAEVLPPDAGASVEAAKSHVIGRYSAGGRDYVMYSDGSVETGAGETLRRFSSLEALRRYLSEQRS